MRDLQHFQSTSFIIEVPGDELRSGLKLTPQDVAPCHLACPVGINVKGYVTAIAEEDFEKALSIVRENNCLPTVCGRICTHPCERECTRGEHGGAINIRALKRFAADYERRQGVDAPLPKLPESKNGKAKSVAVIGAGPAGLAAAHDLALLGHKVTVFEKESRPGGLMTWGIPEFRLPGKAVQYDIDRIERMGVEIRTSAPVADAKALGKIRKEYDAVLLSTGAHMKPAKFRVSPEDIEGVLDHMEFAKAAAQGQVDKKTGTLTVTGFGQSALDMARLAVRAGFSNVYLVYPRTADEFQAFPADIQAARDEGVEMLFQTKALGTVSSSGMIKGLRCVKTSASKPDGNGRVEVVPDKGNEFIVATDYLVPVEPHLPDLSYLPKKSGVELSRWGYVKVDPMSLATGEEGVFAAGDMVTGPKSVIEAMAAGKRAAKSIDGFLRGEKLQASREKKAYPMTLEPAEPACVPAIEPGMNAWKQDEAAGRETEQVYSDTEAVNEARRCLRCGPCMECVKCSSDCSKEVVILGNGEDGRFFRARFQKTVTDDVILRDHPVLDLKRVVTVPPEISTVSSSRLDAEATFCVVDPELCQGCGTCEEICEYRAPRVQFLDGRFVSSIHRDICRECGTCAAHCPSGAIRQQFFTDEFILGQVEKRLKG